MGGHGKPLRRGHDDMSWSGLCLSGRWAWAREVGVRGLWLWTQVISWSPNGAPCFPFAPQQSVLRKKLGASLKMEIALHNFFTQNPPVASSLSQSKVNILCHLSVPWFSSPPLLALQLEVNSDNTLKLFLWLAFCCFCYCNHTWWPVSEICPSAWPLS